MNVMPLCIPQVLHSQAARQAVLLLRILDVERRAQAVGISTRTVETYHEHIKLKPDTRR